MRGPVVVVLSRRLVKRGCGVGVRVGVRVVPWMGGGRGRVKCT